MPDPTTTPPAGSVQRAPELPADPPTGATVDLGALTLQQISVLGVNPFAIELVSESFHTSALRKRIPDNPVSFEWDGVKVTLEQTAVPRHPRIRRLLGLPPTSEELIP